MMLISRARVYYISCIGYPVFSTILRAGPNPIKNIYSGNLCYEGSMCSDWLKNLQ